MRACIALLFVALAGCEGGIVNNATPDATPIPPDAPPDPNYLGQACDPILTPCPAGWECLDQDGGNGAYCTRGCVGQQDPVCNAGYIGPGYGACILVPIGRTDTVCGIVCQDPAGPPTICPPGAACNGTCAAPLECTGLITDANQNVVGSSCQ